MKKMTQNLLMIAASEQDADLYYATKFLAPDSFIFLQIQKKKYLIVSDLEIGRAKKRAKAYQIFPLSQLTEAYGECLGSHPTLVQIAAEFAKRRHVKNFLVPAHFPIKYADFLRKKGIRLHFKDAPFFVGRAIKTKEEIRAISKVTLSIEKAFRVALNILKKSTIKKGKLYSRGHLLTSETIKKMIHTHLINDQVVAMNSIVSCGKHTLDPHHEGRGPLYAHQPIVFDIFPRDLKSRYFSDFSRTVVRGKASAKLKNMYAAVKEAQALAFSKIRADVKASLIHQAIEKRFQELGFRTGLIHGRMQGFFHGTGHGLGLEIHEAPKIGKSDDVLKAGNVVTVEPGLYYADAGGVRLEDVVVVTKKGCLNLTRFPKILEI